MGFRGSVLVRRMGSAIAIGWMLVLAGCGGSDDLEDCDYDSVRRVYVCAGGTPSTESPSEPATADTLYDAYKSLRSGMTKSQVIALVPVSPSQGRDTSQVLWVDNEEALGVRFNGTSDSSVITYAEWGTDIPSGGRQESRNF